ncbi:MAG: polysaccharide deacetylase family protein [Gammaproteobacteria bacterium]|nr:polysaccharide deacetylase family protein [Gammaproteobacteria bacterium]
MKEFRRLVKSSVATLLHQLSVDNLIGHSTGGARGPIVICYHRVVQNFEDAATRAMPSLLISTSMFEKQLDWLAAHFDMVSLDEILQGPQHSGKRRQATITFDDGYADFYWNALPILQKKKIPSAVFVVTDLVGTTNLQIHDELYLLLSHWFKSPEANKELTPGEAPTDPLSATLDATLALHSDPFAAARYFLEVFSRREVVAMLALLQRRVKVSTQSLQEFESLNWPLLRIMHEQGVTIGSHTCSHSLLPHHDQQRVEAELRGSREHLETELGMPTKYLAFPDGQFDERITLAAEAAGYQAALTICNHLSQERPRYTVPRTVLWENACIDNTGRFSPAIMGCLVNGVFNLSSRCAQDHHAS